MRFRVAVFLLWLLLPLASAAEDYVPADYVWTTPGKNASESMPCGGHDVGVNVWVEDGDLLLYIARSGWFDENNTLLKAGRWRVRFDKSPFRGPDFRQRLCLDDGAVYVSGGGVSIRLWADVFAPVVFLEIKDGEKFSATVSYESWRYKDRPMTKAEAQQSSWKWTVSSDVRTRADSIQAADGRLVFSHRNRQETVFDYTVRKEHLDSIRGELYNPLGGRCMRGEMRLPGFRFAGTAAGQYAATDFKAWQYRGEDMRRAVVRISFSEDDVSLTPRQSRRRSAKWWHAYWQRSWITSDHPQVKPLLRRYELFRYLLGCNAYGEWPTKFNGGLFTFDPVFTDAAKPFTPDFRQWGGGTMTAQNQRLVYWPMLKSGDTDMMKAQLDTYLRMLPSAVARTRYYWGHGGASFTEQIENFGLPNPAEYGKHPAGSDYGVEHNKWLAYEWDTALEFCMMALCLHEYTGEDISRYEPLVRQCVTFFDEHYQWEARRRGENPLDSAGHLVIWPGSACETYKMARNASSTIAALKAVLRKWGRAPELLARIPDIPLRVIGGDTCIAPALSWERIQNVETPQLYPVFPWRIYGMGRDGLQTARNTYLKDPHAVEMRSAKGWKQDNIQAACLGLTEEAARLLQEKFKAGPYRFPAFWEPGFDWAPDFNRGGSAMIGLEEMLLQETPDGELILFPAWPKEWNVRFSLHATGRRRVVARMENGGYKLEKVSHY